MSQDKVPKLINTVVKDLAINNNSKKLNFSQARGNSPTDKENKINDDQVLFEKMENLGINQAK